MNAKQDIHYPTLNKRPNDNGIKSNGKDDIWFSFFKGILYFFQQNTSF